MEIRLAHGLPFDEVQAQLRARIEQMLATTGVKPELVDHHAIKKRHVYRQVWRTGDKQHAFVLKSFAPERSCIERRAIERWLPTFGTADLAPALFAVVATSDAQSVWHICEDLGDWTLDVDDRSEQVPRDRGFLAAMATPPEWPRLEAVLAGLARLHDASAGHALLGECRHWTGDLGSHYLRTNIRDAIVALEAMKQLTPSQLSIRDKLSEALARLNNELPNRCAELEAFGGPDCFLHGDFGVRNAMVLPANGEWAARFIDWDHAGVGPASYDLSTLLLQIPDAQRVPALAAYCAFRRPPDNGWPTIDEWNALFDTAERSRFANMAIWSALWAIDGERDSAFENLSAVVSWFDELHPTLRTPSAAPPERTAHG